VGKNHTRSARFALGRTRLQIRTALMTTRHVSSLGRSRGTW
jgi:hypothetical protein